MYFFTWEVQTRASLSTWTTSLSGNSVSLESKQSGPRPSSSVEITYSASTFCPPSGFSTGCRPVTNSRSTTPKLYTSHLAVTSGFEKFAPPSSGAAYPRIVWNFRVAAYVSRMGRNLPRPKSLILGSKLSSKSMLTEDRLRCNTCDLYHIWLQ